MIEEPYSGRTSRRLIFQGLGLGLIGTFFLPGCSLGVMAGKMINGDPLIPADFKNQTKEDLTKGKSTVLVVCTAPDSIDSDHSTLSYDLIDGITRKLKIHGVKVINPDLVASWIDEHGTSQLVPEKLARDFETDYIIFIEVHGFSFREPNSPKLLRGQASGIVKAVEITEIGGRPRPSTVFITEFKSTYPEHQPVSEQGRSSVMFEKEYMDRICVQLAEKFYDHRPGTSSQHPGHRQGKWISMPSRTTYRLFKQKLLSILTGLGVCGSASGCRAVLLLGLLIGGPPTIEPEFDMQTKESLTDKGVTVAVVCFAPTEVKYSFENVDHELAKYVTFRLLENKIIAVPPDHVKRWLDENKDWDKPEEIGAYFKVTYVIYIDINEFSLYEEGSATLYRGRSEAIVNVWKMNEDDGTAEKIFSMEKISRFPSQNPVSTSEETYTNFKGRYLSRLSDEIGRFFYEYYTSDEIGSGS